MLGDDATETAQATRRLWDELVPVHLDSPAYDVEGFKAGGCSLSPFEVEEIGPVDGKSILHLLCHFGLDSLSWVRRGAQVVGLDISTQAIAAAETLEQTTLNRNRLRAESLL